jgi:hypothetical protein
MRKTIPALLCALGIALWWALPLPSYAEGEITVTANAHEHVYKGPMTFSLSVRAESNITAIQLFYRPRGQTAAHKVDLDFEPSTIVEVEHIEDMSKPENHYPPMVAFTYWWTVEDENENRLTTEKTSFVYTDTRYDWETIENEYVWLYWHDQPADFGQHYDDLAVEAASSLANEFDVQVDEPVSIVIYNSHEELMSILQESSAEWTGAVNFGKTGVIAIGLGSESWMDKVIPHELTHAVLNQVTQPPFGEIPRWLHEGLAMRSEGGSSWEEEMALEGAIADNTLISLRVLNSPFADQRERAILSYAESYSLVSFIIEEYGTDKLGELIAIFGRGAHYDDAMNEVFGVDMDGIEDLWRAHIGAAPRTGVTQATPQAAQPTPSPTVLQPAAATATPPTAGPAVQSTAAPESPSQSPRICLGAIPALALTALLALGRLRAA